MSFKKTDQVPYTEQRPLSAAAARAAADNIASIAGTIVPGGGCAYDVRNPPVLFGDGSQGTYDFSGECGMAFMVYPQFFSSQNSRVYNIKLKVENPHATLSLFIQTRILTVDNFIAGNFGNAFSRYELVAGVDTTISLSVGAVQSPINSKSTDPYVIIISGVSQMGAYELLYDPKMSGDETGLEFIYDAGNGITSTADSLWDGTDAQANGQLPYRLVFGRANTSGSYDPGAFDPDVDFTETDEFDGAFAGPPYLHLLKTDGVGGIHPRYYIYPGVSRSVQAGPVDAMARQQMGYALIKGIWLQEDGTNPEDVSPALVAHGQASSATVFQNMLENMNQIAAYGSPPLAIDSGPSYFTDADTTEPSSRRQCMRTLSDNYIKVGEWAVSGPRLDFRTAEDTSTRVRNTYQIDVIAQWQMYHNSASADLSAGLNLRAVIEDSGGDIIGETQPIIAPITPTLTNRQGSIITQRPEYLQGYLLGFSTPESYFYRSDHNMRDLFPFSMVTNLAPRGFRAFYARLTVQDTGNTTKTVGRLLRLEAQISNEVAYPPGILNPGQHSLIIWAAHVSYVRSSDPTVLGDS